jgi:hypothetical protein
MKGKKKKRERQKCNLITQLFGNNFRHEKDRYHGSNIRHEQQCQVFVYAKEQLQRVRKRG